MKVLLTGASGFIGGHVLPLLSDHEVMCLNRRNLADVPPFGPEIVIHCAWPGVAGDGRWDPEVQREGWQLTADLRRACEATCKRWVSIGSQSELTQPHVAYARVKRLCRMETQRWANRRGIAFAWARLYSVYGPGEPPHSFLPYLIRELLEGREPALTDQNIPWDFLYITDAAAAIARLAEGTELGIFEVAYGETIYTQDAAQLARDLLSPLTQLRFGARPRRAIEIAGFVPDVSRIKAAGWSPRVPLHQGIRRLAEALRARRAA